MSIERVPRLEPKLTRIRAEATGEDPAKLAVFLADMIENVRSPYGGEWEEEEPGVVTMTATRGFWGRYTLRRKDGT